LIKTYRGSFLGWIWALVKPAITIFVYWFAFAIGLRHGKTISGFPFFLWLLAGIMPWFYMNEMFHSGTGCIRKYSYLVTKMKFPISTIPTFVSLSSLFVHLMLTIITIGIFWVMGYPPDIYYLQLPYYMLAMFCVFWLWDLFSAPLAVLSKDFYQLIKSITTAIFWLSGILWDVNNIEIPWLHRLLYFNPVTYIAQGYRNVFIYKTWFFADTKPLIGFWCVFACGLAISVWVFNRLRKDIPDVL
jgi:teichoic acid transport system permease protein